MNTLLDRRTQEDQDRELHNAMIAERYKEILGVVEGQIEKREPAMNATQTTYAPVEEAPTVAPSYRAPAMEQVPHVTEYTPSSIAASLFTTETLDRIAPQPVPSVVAPKAVADENAVAVREASYSLTPMAKAAIAIFAATVVGLLALIGVNSMSIKRKNIRLRNLEEKKQELMERNGEIQQYIDELQTEESIIERATEAGLLD